MHSTSPSSAPQGRRWGQAHSAGSPAPPRTIGRSNSDCGMLSKTGGVMPEKQTDKVAETETTSSSATRRELLQIGNVLALPVLLGGMEAKAAAGPLKAGAGIYQSIGVEPVINCRGTFTIICGSVELPQGPAAMDAASRYFVQIDELAD